MGTTPPSLSGGSGRLGVKITLKPPGAAFIIMPAHGIAATLSAGYWRPAVDGKDVDNDSAFRLNGRGCFSVIATPWFR